MFNVTLPCRLKLGYKQLYLIRSSAYIGLLWSSCYCAYKTHLYLVSTPGKMTSWLLWMCLHCSVFYLVSELMQLLEWSKKKYEKLCQSKCQAQKAIPFPVHELAHSTPYITELDNVDVALEAMLLATLLVADHLRNWCWSACILHMLIMTYVKIFKRRWFTSYVGRQTGLPIPGYHQR